MEHSSEVGSHDGSPLDWSRSSPHVPLVRQSPLSTVNYDTVMSLLNTATTGARSCSTCKKRPAAMSLLADVAIPCPSSSRRGCAWISSCSSSATASTRSARAANLQVRELQGSSVGLGSRREQVLNFVVLQEISPKQE